MEKKGGGEEGVAGNEEEHHAVKVCDWMGQGVGGA